MNHLLPNHTDNCIVDGPHFLRKRKGKHYFYYSIQECTGLKLWSLGIEIFPGEIYYGGRYLTLERLKSYWNNGDK